MLFGEIIGQNQARRKLVETVRQGRIPHAQLFFGPEGCGSLPLAMAYATYLTCDQRGEEDACGICPSCQKQARMIHPDVHFSFPFITAKDNSKPKCNDFIEEFRQSVLANPYLDLNDWMEAIGSENKQSIISVEESADLLRKLHLKSFESGFKIVILWMPEKLRTDAANKLLKIIEEPPELTIFLLVASHHDQILPTILSRTQQVRLQQLPDTLVSEALTSSYKLPLEQARLTARIADGNYHAALAMINREEGEERFEMEFLEWMRLCFRPYKSAGKLLGWVEQTARLGRERQKSMLLFTIQTIRDCLISNMADLSMNRMDSHQMETLKDFIPWITANNADEFIHELNQAYYHVERNANPKILFLDLSLRLHHVLNAR